MKYYHQRFPKHLLFSAILAASCFVALKDSWIPAQMGSVPFYGALFVLVMIGVVFVSSALTAAYEQKKHLRGTTLVSNSEFDDEIDGDGLAIPNNGPDRDKDPQFLQIAATDESKHILICGDTGAGKSSILHYFAKQIRIRQNELAVFYDAKAEFYKCHGRDRQGDIWLYPFSDDCPYWDLAAEIGDRPEKAKLIAESLLPCTPGREDEFFVATPREILEFMLLELSDTEGTIGEFLMWLNSGDEIDRIIDGEPISQAIPREAPDQRAGVLGSLSRVASNLKYLPQYPDRRERFSLAEWVQRRPGWLFIGASGVSDQQVLQPLFSIWFNILFQQLLDVPSGTKPPATWVFIDELASLKTLGCLEQAMSQARSYNTRLVLGFQNKYQIENFYGKLSQPILSAPKTKIFLRTTETESAEWVAKMLGEPEFEQKIASESSQLTGRRGESISYRQERKTEYLVLPSEFVRLPDREGYLQYQGISTPIQFAYPVLQEVNSVERGRHRPSRKRNLGQYKLGRDLVFEGEF
jgi:ABC-type cobalamin/Fe3+-siderophores transport system ATPase subunit